MEEDSDSDSSSNRKTERNKNKYNAKNTTNEILRDENHPVYLNI